MFAQLHPGKLWIFVLDECRSSAFLATPLIEFSGSAEALFERRSCHGEGSVRLLLESRRCFYGLKGRAVPGFFVAAPKFL